MKAGRTRGGVLVSMTLAGLVFSSAVTHAAPQDPKAAAPHDHAAMQTAQQAAGSNTEMSSHMMAMQQQMMAEHAAAAARLKDLLDKMNRAKKGDAKVDAIAAVVAELASQRLVMQQQMEHMSHMMMMSGGMSGAGDHGAMMKNMAPPAVPQP